MQLITKLISEELGLAPTIVSCRRIGKLPTVNQPKPQLLLVVFSSSVDRCDVIEQDQEPTELSKGIQPFEINSLPVVKVTECCSRRVQDKVPYTSKGRGTYPRFSRGDFFGYYGNFLYLHGT